METKTEVMTEPHVGISILIEEKRLVGVCWNVGSIHGHRFNEELLIEEGSLVLKTTTTHPYFHGSETVLFDKEHNLDSNGLSRIFYEMVPNTEAHLEFIPL